MPIVQNICEKLVDICHLTAVCTVTCRESSEIFHSNQQRVIKNNPTRDIDFDVEMC